jgi:hypothetical protein
LEEKIVYTIDNARQDVKGLLEEGYDVWSFLNDLSRSGDISWEENKIIRHEIIEGKFG